MAFILSLSKDDSEHHLPKWVHPLMLNLSAVATIGCICKIKLIISYGNLI